MNQQASSSSLERIQSLGLFLQQYGLAGLWIPRTDEFLNEFIPAYAERLAWLTGFRGSAGLALATLHKTILFVDGRYTLQAHQEVNPDLVTVKSWTDAAVEAELRENFQRGDVVGYDPWLHSIRDSERFERSAQEVGFKLRPLSMNPIDTLWKDQPARPKASLFPHPLVYSGCSFEEKRLLIKAAHFDIDFWVLTSNTSLAWLLNIRGGDIPYTPVSQAYGLLDQGGELDLFVDLSKVSDKLRAFLEDSVHFFPLEEFSFHLQNKTRGKKVSVDPTQTPAAVGTLLSEATVVFQPDPCILPRALKNKTEIEGMKRAHIEDAVALVRFLHWLSEIPLDGSENEFSAAQKLEKFRQENEAYQGPSFETIAGHGPNGAIVHYRPPPQVSRPLTTEALFLVDSGGQYAFGGTTDVTRTMALGAPTAQQKEHYTRVLKGHIAIARAVFPPGTCGSQLDILARLPLWEKGLDFDHGTGHGVGSYLAVHEGPQNISRKGPQIPLQPGMILSNEPGYYQPGKYGIRLENLVIVVEKEHAPSMMGFETITFVPFDHQLINIDLLTEDEKSWINDYHQQIYTALSPHLDVLVRQWLKKEINKMDCSLIN